MKNIGEIFDRMFYWEVGRREITMSGKKVEEGYDIHVVKVEGSGIMPYEIYVKELEKRKKRIERKLREKPEGYVIERTSEITFRLPDPFGLNRLLDKFGFLD